MRTIEKFYSRFGEDVVGVVKAKAKPDGDIKHLLTHLGLPVTGVIDRQHRILVEFVHTHGKSVFIKAVGLSGGAIAVKRLLQEIELQKVKERRERSLMRLSGVPLGAGVSAPDQPRVVYRQATPSPDDGRKWIETPTYAGPDRRAGAERRTGPGDRRTSLELITFKNRRFGGKRRKVQRRSGI